MVLWGPRPCRDRSRPSPIRNDGVSRRLLLTSTLGLLVQTLNQIPVSAPTVKSVPLYRDMLSAVLVEIKAPLGATIVCLSTL